MQEILDETLTVTTRDAYVRVDVTFHALLARSTQNELFVLLLDSIAEIMSKVREMAFDIPSAPHRAHKYHSLILDQVKAGNAEGARQAMRDHLIEAEATMLSVMALYAQHGSDSESTRAPE